jgi:hypothetical protein
MKPIYMSGPWITEHETNINVEFSAEQMPNITSYEAIMKALDQLGVR